MLDMSDDARMVQQAEYLCLLNRFLDFLWFHFVQRDHFDDNLRRWLRTNLGDVCSPERSCSDFLQIFVSIRHFSFLLVACQGLFDRVLALTRSSERARFEEKN